MKEQGAETAESVSGLNPDRLSTPPPDRNIYILEIVSSSYLIHTYGDRLINDGLEIEREI